MQFTKGNLKKLLSKSEGLDLLPPKKRRDTVQAVLDSSIVDQRKVFHILMIERKEVEKAEEIYQKTVSSALDNFTADVQIIQKDAIRNLRGKTEKFEQEKEKTKMLNLLEKIK